MDEPPVEEKPSWHLSPGDEAVPHCTVLEHLGGGRRFEVLAAWDDRLLTTVIVKVVRPHLLDHAGTQRAVRREIDVLRRVDHPNVVRCFGAEADGPSPHLILQRVPGRVQSTHVRSEGPLRGDQLLELGTALASALHHLHWADVVHLDVKPSNVIVGREMTLIDFSLARPSATAAELTVHVGTTAYMSPEQCAPPTTGRPGPASDVWGLGATLVHAATGHRPFDRGSTVPTDPLEARYPQLVQPPPDLADAVDPRLAAVIRGCLARDPQDRPSPLDVVNELRAIDGLPPVVGSATPGPAAAADPDGERIRRQFDAALRAKGGRPPSRRSR